MRYGKMTLAWGSALLAATLAVAACDRNPPTNTVNHSQYNQVDPRVPITPRPNEHEK